MASGTQLDLFYQKVSVDIQFRKHLESEDWAAWRTLKTLSVAKTPNGLL